MIRCEKCGKLYDYGKTDGICPNCSRYNRPDGAELKQDLHERYDSVPNAHSEEYHKEIHRINGDKSSHQRASHAENAYDYSNPSGVQRMRGDSRAAKKIFFIVLIIVAVIIAVLAAGAAVIGRMAGSGSISGEYVSELSDDIYADSAWMTLLGSELTTEALEEESVYPNEEESDAIAALPAQENGGYYLLTVCINNDAWKSLDLSEMTPDDVSISMDGTERECLFAFHSLNDVIDGFDYGYVDCVFFLSDEERAPYLEQESVEMDISIDLGLDEPLTYTYDEYIYYDGTDDYDDYDDESLDYL